MVEIVKNKINRMNKKHSKKDYKKPEITCHGTVQELTESKLEYTGEDNLDCSTFSWGKKPKPHH